MITEQRGNLDIIVLRVAVSMNETVPIASFLSLSSHSMEILFSEWFVVSGELFHAIL